MRRTPSRLKAVAEAAAKCVWMLFECTDEGDVTIVWYPAGRPGITSEAFLISSRYNDCQGCDVYRNRSHVVFASIAVEKDCRSGTASPPLLEGSVAIANLG
jgi:hypothetical protein